jgi:hypothetical protein
MGRKVSDLRKFLAACICVSCAYVTGCEKPTASAPASQTTDVGLTYRAPDGTGVRTIDGIEYEYVATHERENEIVNGFPKLAVGQSREEVRAAMGLPDRAEPMYGKERNAPFHGWWYMHKIKMRSGGPNTNDICIEVFFSPKGKLSWAVPNHIEDLKEVGSPAGP